MDHEFEKIVDLTKEIFRRSANVSSYTVRKINTRYRVNILNSKKKIVFGMQGSYDNVKKVCLLIIEEQKVNGGRLYAE